MNRIRVRKQVYELTAADLEAHPIWEFALDEEGEDGQDEATVRPYDTGDALDPAAGMFIVRARLTLADGTPVVGYLTPPVAGDSSLGTLQPTILTPTGQVSFWCGMLAPEPVYIAESYKRLGKSAAEHVFPLRFESDVHIVGGSIRGELPGFLVIVDFGTRRTRTVW